MALFQATYHGKLDTKNRVSVPAPYRTQLKLGSANAPLPANAATPLVIRPSHRHPCLEVWTERDFAALAAPLEKLDPFSVEYEDLSLTLFGDAEPMEADKEGRIVLPAKLIEHAELDQSRQISFAGHFRTFQIWDSALLAQRKLAANKATNERDLLRARVIT